MKISSQTKREAKALYRSCVVKGVLDEKRVREVVRQVAGARPRGFLGILSHFQRLLRLEIDRRAARVESAAPLLAELQTDVKKRLGGLYGPGLDIAFAQNPALLGGLRVKVGCDVYDGSIQARLNELAESF
jgi:F-type H+-transporting ATPase subunit delta